MERVAPQQKESNVRSLSKAFSWRFIATFTTGTIAYLGTGQLELAASIMGFDFVIKLVLYYGHERIWQAVPHGTFPRIDGH